MLEKIDLRKSIPKKDYKTIMPALREQLYALQHTFWEKKIASIVLFEGWDAAGKGTNIKVLTQRLDPRGFKLYPIRAPRTFEQRYPWLWRFWLKLPNYGEVAIFDRSWYGRVLVERIDELVPKQKWQRSYQDIVQFERMLADDGQVLIKFWLHISKKEQKKRFKAIEKDPFTRWQVTKEDWKHHKQYKQYLETVEEMLERTDTEWGPWTIVEGTDRRWSRIKIFQTIVNAFSDALERRGETLPFPEDERIPFLG
jgi:polyphosphate kinase 2 (PPK2 family)